MYSSYIIVNLWAPCFIHFYGSMQQYVLLHEYEESTVLWCILTSVPVLEWNVCVEFNREWINKSNLGMNKNQSSEWTNIVNKGLRRLCAWYCTDITSEFCDGNRYKCALFHNSYSNSKYFDNEIKYRNTLYTHWIQSQDNIRYTVSCIGANAARCLLSSLPLPF